MIAFVRNALLQHDATRAFFGLLILFLLNTIGTYIWDECVPYLFVATKEFPHWNRRTGTHGNHRYQYTD